MLVLSRKTGEQVIIGGNISVTVLEVDRNRVRLGFTAPDDVRIMRNELTGEPKHKPKRAARSTDWQVAAAVADLALQH